MQTAIELPQYQCHKKVRAVKIKSIWKTEHGVSLVPEAPFAAIPVTLEHMAKHKPQVGGYHVVYEDGYTSYSPAKAFEEGYTRI